MDGGVSVFPNGILKSGWQCFEVDGSVYFGISVFWYFGVLVFRCFGILVFRCFGILVFRCFGILVFRCSESCGLRCDTGTRAGAWILGSRSFGCYPQHINGTTASAPTPHAAVRSNTTAQRAFLHTLPSSSAAKRRAAVRFCLKPPSRVR